MEIPVYLFSGFMDSGKSSLIRETLVEGDFSENGRTLLILCEDGEVEFEEEELLKVNTKLAMIEEEEGFTSEKLQELDKTYRPDQVFIEYNGTWQMASFLETELPKNWVLVQSLATVDATTFEMYGKAAGKCPVPGQGRQPFHIKIRMRHHPIQASPVEMLMKASVSIFLKKIADFLELHIKSGNAVVFN